MQVALDPSQSIPIRQDNTKIRIDTNNLFKTVNLKFNSGATFEEKFSGLELMTQGCTQLKIWITRETDQQTISSLTQLYEEWKQDILKKRTWLEQYKNGQSQPVIQNQTKGVPVPDKTTKDDPLQNQISNAITTNLPSVKWDDIIGLKQAKAALKQAIVLPNMLPHVFVGAREPWRGILLYGPPGTGKTDLARACATETNSTFFSVKASNLISKYVGESEKLISILFQTARERKPSVIFLDEVDALCGSRGEGQTEASRRVVTELLTQMDGIGEDGKGVLVLGATNTPWSIDQGIRRRFQKRVYISLPDKEARKHIIASKLRNNEHSLTNAQLDMVAEQTDGFSGADLSILVTQTLMAPIDLLQEATKFKDIRSMMYLAMREDEQSSSTVQTTFDKLDPLTIYVPPVSIEDLLRSLKSIKPSADQGQIKEYQEWTAKFGQDG